MLFFKKDFPELFNPLFLYSSIMKSIVEYFEIRQNNFTRWLFLLLVVFSAFAFMIIDKADDKKWIALFCIVLFGGGLLAGYNFKIIVQQEGFELKNLRGRKFVLWKDITSLHYDMVYNVHGAQAELKIMVGNKTIPLQVEQYRSKPMQRFFEVLNEQCTNASKNIHFINQASGKMNLRNKLKMF